MELSFFHLDSINDSYARFPFILEAQALEGLECRVSFCSAGNMVNKNGSNGPEREAFFRALGKDIRQVYACTQRHSRTVFAVDRNSLNNGPQGDGLVTADPEICLSVVVADCLPIFLWDLRKRESLSPNHRLSRGPFALVHSGWQGTGIALEALDLMAKLWDTRPEDVAAVFGPCIQPCCYRVDEARALAFEKEFGGSGGFYPLGPVTQKRDDAYYLDLPAANARLLANQGLQSLSVCKNCTVMDERLGSFRREGPLYTRMAAVLGYFS